ncbi:hypothetical protein EVAR_89621_1 [Eumeta japonica]|uniref:Uncharacterized protein n=1 Tax=Eumeta variegata TaxID=151549 RepID=A0A4C1ZFT4_EUMVA|nr:hypothetical protein EVAR_89621_1 [Eumeta japonica]
MPPLGETKKNRPVCDRTTSECIDNSFSRNPEHFRAADLLSNILGNIHKKANGEAQCVDFTTSELTPLISRTSVAVAYLYMAAFAQERRPPNPPPPPESRNTRPTVRVEAGDEAVIAYSSRGTALPSSAGIFVNPCQDSRNQDVYGLSQSLAE